MMPPGADSLADNATYNERLGRILARAGKNLDEAADLLARSLLGVDSKAVSSDLEDVLKKQGATDLPAAKLALFKKNGDAHIAGASDKAAAQSRIAMSYSRMGILPEEALSLARTAVDNLSARSSSDTMYQSHRTYGIALSSAGKHEEAVAAFGKVRQLATFFDVDYYLRYGESLTALGLEREALEVYMKGAAVGQPSKLMAALTPLYKKLHGSDEGIKGALKKISDEIAAFKPAGPARTSRSGQVVLAELFTGSECRPCLAADKASTS